MRSLVLALPTLAALVGATPAPLGSLTSPSDLTTNANHVFNAIHSALRQWGSSLNHNGMSYFLATVPKGTQLYHGTSKEEPISGMEWLAYEPEHSLVFSGRHGGPPPFHDNFRLNDQQQPLFESGPPEDDDDLAGYLHTYCAAHPLRLIYVDGEAAAKSDKGTLDTQDYILLNGTEKKGVFWDFERAKGMCELAATEWKGQIHGILRMEGGFEIILCSFKDSLEVVRITRAKSDSRLEEQKFDYYRAITARYDGVGGDRTLLNYDQFVTGFDAKYGIDLFREVEGRTLPRLMNATAKQVGMMREDIRRVVLGMGTDVSLPEHSFNWQGVADMIVGRYAARLKYLVSPSLSTLEAFQREIDSTLQPFIDYARRNSTTESERCATQFIPETAPTASESMAAAAVSHVAHTICSTLLSASEETSYEAAVEKVKELIEYLDWTTWKECGACDPDKLCMLPIWPFGSLEDFMHPTCMNATQMTGRRGYWRLWGRS
ncbi:hypothetical protein NEOLEDRAFT_1065347 [Neolentinus lepideus HHB14362 ss-1]|uniref:Uncharacterized protein n=1 Tax=Neolentinus lepideus HHB14362 ss-1 TaxID=1314782 RepID=A0A165SL15_9AGAM|nr:hypothetical protein NEOLEDRAFT_1065347 [Neolentinus lepideus HHB14362 ss-1]